MARWKVLLGVPPRILMAACSGHHHTRGIVGWQRSLNDFPDAMRAAIAVALFVESGYFGSLTYPGLATHTARASPLATCRNYRALLLPSY